MINELLEKFEDVFKPSSKSELDKRYTEGKCFSCGEWKDVKKEGKVKDTNLQVYMCKDCLEGGAKEELNVVDEATDFEDTFKPISKEERGKRNIPWFVDEVESWSGLKLTDEQVHGIVYSLAMNAELRNDFFGHLKEVKKDYDWNWRDAHPEDEEEYEPEDEDN